MNNVQTLDLTRVLDQLTTLLIDPTSNISAALILYGMIGLVVLMVLIIGIVVLMGTPDDEVVTPGKVSEPTVPSEHVAGTSDDGETAAEEPETPTRGSRTAFVAPAVVVLVLLVVWALAGYTTSQDAVCRACHVETVHAKATKNDPHTSAACVSCHEPSGLFGRYFSSVPSRMLHFVDGAVGLSAQPDYGQVSSSACLNCHSEDVVGVNTDPVTGVRISHKEPLAASAMCLDCHELQSGMVTRQTVGMGPCLRCHNSVSASSECSTCHNKQSAAAARAKSTAFAKPQVAEVKCGGCHDERQECDSCHGLRMPHSDAFKAGAHARAGAVNFWFNDGKTCSNQGCHTATRRPCTKCHTALLGHAHPKAQATIHQGAADSQPCNTCHIQWAVTRNRDFCLLCHSEAAIKESPR